MENRTGKRRKIERRTNQSKWKTTSKRERGTQGGRRTETPEQEGGDINHPSCAPDTSTTALNGRCRPPTHHEDSESATHTHTHAGMQAPEQPRPPEKRRMSMMTMRPQMQEACMCVDTQDTSSFPARRPNCRIALLAPRASIQTLDWLLQREAYLTCRSSHRHSSSIRESIGPRTDPDQASLDPSRPKAV